MSSAMIVIPRMVSRPCRRSASSVSDLPVAVSPMTRTFTDRRSFRWMSAIAPWNGIRPRFIIRMLCSVSAIFFR